MVRLDEQVDEVMAVNGDVSDRLTIGDGHLRLEPGSGLEPLVELPSHGVTIVLPDVTREQSVGVGPVEAAMVILRLGGDIVGGRSTDGDPVHVEMLARR